VAEREATLQLQKAEAVAFAVRGARTELRQLAGAQRAKEAGASAAATVAAQAQQVRAAGVTRCSAVLCWLLQAACASNMQQTDAAA
jgi:hypothetical protein